MIQPNNGAEALYVTTLAAHRVRSIRADQNKEPYKQHDQAFRDVVTKVGPVFKDRDKGLVEWAEMLANSVLAGGSEPAVERLLAPPVIDPEEEEAKTAYLDGIADEVVAEIAAEEEEEETPSPTRTRRTKKAR